MPIPSLIFGTFCKYSFYKIKKIKHKNLNWVRCREGKYYCLSEKCKTTVGRGPFFIPDKIFKCRMIEDLNITTA